MTFLTHISACGNTKDRQCTWAESLHLPVVGEAYGGYQYGLALIWVEHLNSGYESTTGCRPGTL